MAKRKEQYRKQQIATVGHSNKHIRVMSALFKKMERVAMLRGYKEVS